MNLISNLRPLITWRIRCDDREQELKRQKKNHLNSTLFHVLFFIIMIDIIMVFYPVLSINKNEKNG